MKKTIVVLLLSLSLNFVHASCASLAGVYVNCTNSGVETPELETKNLSISINNLEFTISGEMNSGEKFQGVAIADGVTRMTTETDPDLGEFTLENTVTCENDILKSVEIVLWDGEILMDEIEEFELTENGIKITSTTNEEIYNIAICEKI